MDKARPHRSCAQTLKSGFSAGLGIGHRMVRTRRWKYMLSDVNEEALFDLENDPYELTNLLDEPAARASLQRLRKSLSAWMDRVGDRHERPPDN